jgi:surface carbohydrate biosynthesis protein
MNIYLPIEVKLRELEGKMLLAMVAAERGHVVIIGEKKDTLNLAKAGKLPPGVVHDKSFTPGQYKIDYFKKLKEYGHFISGQDEETGLLDESFDDFATRRFSEETISLADKVFAWGAHDAQSLREIYPNYKNRIIATGSPRVDLWRSEFDSYYKKSTTVRNPDILVASNFGYPIDENPFWNRVARLRKAGYFERDPEMEKYLYSGWFTPNTVPAPARAFVL